MTRKMGLTSPLLLICWIARFRFGSLAEIVVVGVMDCQFVALQRSWLRERTLADIAYKGLGARMSPLMREYVRALIKDFVTAIELASEDCAGFSRELAEDLDALALAAVVGVSEALRDLLGQHECDQLGLLHRLKVLLIIIIFDFITTVNVVVKIGGINIIKHQMVILILQRLQDLI